MLTSEELQQKLIYFSNESKLFFHAYGLGELILDMPVDHIAAKGLHRQEYDQYLKEFLPLSSRLSYSQIDGRLLALAKLYEPLDCGEFGNCSLLEIMEPKSNAAITTHDMIDHFSLYAEDLDIVRSALQFKEVEFTEREYSGHRALIIPINEWDQEVKFTDKRLSELISIQIADGTALVHK